MVSLVAPKEKTRTKVAMAKTVRMAAGLATNRTPSRRASRASIAGVITAVGAALRIVATVVLEDKGASTASAGMISGLAANRALTAGLAVTGRCRSPGK